MQKTAVENIAVFFCWHKNNIEKTLDYRLSKFYYVILLNYVKSIKNRL